MSLKLTRISSHIDVTLYIWIRLYKMNVVIKCLCCIKLTPIYSNTVFYCADIRYSFTDLIWGNLNNHIYNFMHVTHVSLWCRDMCNRTGSIFNTHVYRYMILEYFFTIVYNVYIWTDACKLNVKMYVWIGSQRPFIDVHMCRCIRVSKEYTFLTYIACTRICI